MKKLLLVGLLLGGCASTNQPETEIEKLLAKQAAMERLKTPVVCPKGTIKICQGPNKKMIGKYYNVFCKCYSERSVRREFELWSRGL